jgi:uncharacterized membrane protein HdeD (DUF308 family)
MTIPGFHRGTAAWRIADQHSLGMALQEIRGSWRGSVALGVVVMIAGGIAGTNLFVAGSASILYIGAVMFAGGLLELVDAMAVADWRGERLRLLAGAIYGFAGAIIIFDPLFASATLSLALAILLSFVGALRIAFGFQHHDEEAQGSVVAAGAFTVIAAAVVLVAWPGISLWLLGTVLIVDLIFQGWSFATLGLAIRARC